MCNHTQSEHEAFKAPGVWETLEVIAGGSYQVGDDVHGDLEMRNAPCGSTLARRCMLTPERREEIRAEVRSRNAAFGGQLRAALGRRAA